MKIVSRVAAAAVFLLGLGGAVRADSVDAKGDLFLRERVREQPSGQARALVQLTCRLDALKRSEIASLGRIVSEIPSMNLVVTQIAHGQLRQLADKPYVRRLSLDALVRKSDEFITASSGASAASAQYGVSGAGVTVAVLDSGVQVTHPDIAGQLWVNDGETPGDGVDDDGNGFIDDICRGWLLDQLLDPVGLPVVEAGDVDVGDAGVAALGLAGRPAHQLDAAEPLAGREPENFFQRLVGQDGADEAELHGNAPDGCGRLVRAGWRL